MSVGSGDYRWVAYDSVGAVVSDGIPAGAFPTQADAEAWFAESWEEFADAGVAAVSLVHFEDVVYGPMPLTPA